MYKKKLNVTAVSLQPDKDDIDCLPQISKCNWGGRADISSNSEIDGNVNVSFSSTDCGVCSISAYIVLH